MKVEKLCNFYASKYHLSIILLEYLKEKKIKKYNVISFLQEELEDEINVLVQKYEYDKELKKGIDFRVTKDIYKKELKDLKNTVFIVQGNLQYIKEANEYILDSLENNINVKIINCYNFLHQKLYMRDIIAKSDKILFTTGEKIID